MQMVFCPRRSLDERSATGMTSPLRMISGDDRRGRQYIRAATQLTWTSDSIPEIRDEQTFSEIRRRVAWGIVGLLDGTRLGSSHHQSLSRGGRHLSIPSHKIDLRNPECHSAQRVFSMLSHGHGNGCRLICRPVSATAVTIT